MTDLTFIIPIGPAHQHLAQRAIQSAAAQTVKCAILTMLDADRRGPGALRNQMIRQAETEFVSFLDADDWVEPTFAEETIREYRRIGGNAYIYTDWMDAEGNVVQAPCINGPDGYPISMPDRKPYCGGTWHVITTLIPTQWAKGVLFDEEMPGSEDTNFYLNLCTSMRCGHRLARPLFHYSPNGGRSLSFRNSESHDRVMQELTIRYGGRMGCCGGDNRVIPPVGERQPEDVLAMALWMGNRSEFGRVTGRHYPRISLPRTAWVDPRDVAQSPELWSVVEQPKVDAPQGITSLAQMAAIGLAGVKAKANPGPDYSVPTNEPPPPIVTAKPDVARLLRLANPATEFDAPIPGILVGKNVTAEEFADIAKQAQAMGVGRRADRSTPSTDDPIFIFPEKDYPSYRDIKTLVKLSGFDLIEGWKIDAFSKRPYIVVSPEPIIDLNGLKSRVICWQLEYAGDYTHNYDGFQGEVWASDKAWADANGAKYVLMGSHPGLADGEPLEPWHDVTMLGYMIPRRQAIKDQLSGLRWPADYPGHGTPERATVLLRTRMMLHVHQHENSLYCAPQRIALAAAHHMTVVSETVTDPGDLAEYVTYADYAKIPATVKRVLKKNGDRGLHEFLCVERTFRKCVEEALKSA